MKNIKNSKILFLCTTDNMIWQFLIPHINDLLSYGAKVDCVCSKTGFWFDELKSKYNFNMIDIKMKRKPINLTNLKAYFSLKKLCRENKYDLIYCQQPTGGMLGRLISGRGKKHIPVIYTAHGFFFFKGNSFLKNFVFKTAEKYLAKYTDILITMNDEDFEACKNWKAKKKYKIHGIGLDVDKYTDSNNLTNLKKELGISPEEKIILSVSEFIGRKNYPTMLNTVAQLFKQRNDFRYVLCGTGELFENMKNLSCELGLQDRALFLGYRKDINNIMQIADIFYHESFHEGLTMSIMEAMHFGLPVITSNVRGNKDLIDEKGGFLTEPMDIDSQLTALNRLLDNQSLRLKMGKYNRNKIKDYYLESIRKELKNIYQENGLL